MFLVLCLAELRITHALRLQAEIGPRSCGTSQPVRLSVVFLATWAVSTQLNSVEMLLYLQVVGDEIPVCNRFSSSNPLSYLKVHSTPLSVYGTFGIYPTSIFQLFFLR